MALYDTDDEQEKVVLVGVELNPLDDCEKSLEELAELAKTAGAVTVGKMIQPRDSFHPATYIGKGKLEELRLMIDELKMFLILRLWTEQWLFLIYLPQELHQVKVRYRLRWHS